MKPSKPLGRISHQPETISRLDKLSPEKGYANIYSNAERKQPPTNETLQKVVRNVGKK